ncbi:hypothetical protein [Roseobacter sp. HKCCA0434]|uniref:MotE family protein n=1 Tax=Roseobacter sp. HKCCA0434 TaxID=3079297 RepID=UPI002905A6B7|nr:hypothetical protein [Roseobacter sp. HKCCA0434]
MKAARRVSALAILAFLLVSSAAVRFVDHAGAVSQIVAGVVPAAIATPRSSEAVADLGEEDAMLRALRTRAAELDRRERDLAALEQDLERTRAGLEDQVDALRQAEEDLRATLALAEGAADADVARLTGVYEQMRSAQAAAIFEEMDPSFAAGFLLRMEPGKAAAILSEISAGQAYALSAVMAGRHAGGGQSR